MPQNYPMQSKLNDQIELRIYNFVFFVDFDWVKFNGDCKQVIKEVRDRFMDLANEIVDDDNSHYVEQMQEKQEKFT